MKTPHPLPKLALDRIHAPKPQGPLPLQGRLILDCSALLPAPFVGKLLALKGARVLKIENPNRPDPARNMGPYYRDINDCKELVELDITSPEGRARFHDLVRQADGLIEGFRPSAKKKLGLDEETLLKVNPKLVIGSIIGYPEQGPWKDRAGHDMNFGAVTGVLSLFNEMPALPLADLFAAYDCALSMAAQLDQVARGGQGGRIPTSMTEALLQTQSVLIREHQESGHIPHPQTTLFSGKYPCYRIYRAGDGRRVTVGAIERKFWQKVCEILGVPELADESHATGDRGEQVASKIQAVLGSKPWPHWAPLFDEADCCVEPVLDFSEVDFNGL